jgi:hypothetical protein
MKLLEDVKTIYSKYPWFPYEIPEGYKSLYDYVHGNELPEEEHRLYFPMKRSSYLQNKYKDLIPKGWYGFDMGTPIHPQWILILDEVVGFLHKNDPDFTIQQVKIKFGGVRFYVSSILIEDIYEIESFLEENLYDKALIY